MPHSYQWVVSQIGARQHYGIPRGFQSAGRLARLYTDAWYPASLRWMLRFANPSLRAFGGRWHEGIPRRKVVHFNVRTLGQALRQKSAGTPTIEQQHEEFLRIGRHFDRCVAEDLAQPGRITPGRDAFFSFNTGALQTLRTLRARGVRTVLDQIDPAKFEEDLVYQEAEKWPGWEAIGGRVPQEYWDHMSAEWAEADLVMVNSGWSRNALIKQGVPAGKIIVIPIGYEPEGRVTPRRARKSGPLTVLWLGTVILRKGIQYLIEAAKLLEGNGIKFVVAGPVGISRRALSTAPSNMEFVGRITRDQAEGIYAHADIFVLPTISDGFAITQLEAMSMGLPVIATPNCGEVVTHGRDGLIVPACDAAALAAAITQLNADRELLAEMSRNAVARAVQFELPSNTQQIETEVRAWEERH